MDEYGQLVDEVLAQIDKELRERFGNLIPARPQNFADAGVIFCPYLPLYVTDSIGPLPPGYKHVKRSVFHPSELEYIKRYGSYGDYAI